MFVHLHIPSSFVGMKWSTFLCKNYFFLFYYPIFLCYQFIIRKSMPKKCDDKKKNGDQNINDRPEGAYQDIFGIQCLLLNYVSCKPYFVLLINFFRHQLLNCELMSKKKKRITKYNFFFLDFTKSWAGIDCHN